MPLLLPQTGDTLTAMLSGEIDHHTAAAMRSEIDLAIETRCPKALVLDFGGVTFMDSSGIGLVMGRYKRMHALGGTVTLANVPQPLRRVMRLAGLENLARLEQKEDVTP